MQNDGRLTDECLTLSVNSAAKMLGISRNLAYDLARRGELPGTIKLGQKRLVVSRIAIERLLQGDGNKAESIPKLRV